MPFDLEPSVAEAVERLQGLYPRPPHLMSPAEVKAVMAPLPADPKARPGDVEVTDDALMLGEPPRRIGIRRFLPPAAPARVVYFHGGGFTTGGLDSHDAPCAWLASEAATEVVSVDYRKLPDHPFPAAYEDTVEAVRKLGADGVPLALAGDSSGANLALAAALALRGEVKLQGLLLYYPVVGLDFATQSYRDNAEAPALTAARCQRIWSDYLADDIDGAVKRRDWRAAPLLADDFRALPPTVVVVAEYDPLLSDGTILADRLRADGVPTTLVHAARTPHGFLRWRGISKGAAEAIGEATRAFAAQLR